MIAAIVLGWDVLHSTDFNLAVVTVALRAHSLLGAVLGLLLIASMTFVLITSSGAMGMAVNCAYRRHRFNASTLMFVTAARGGTFVLISAFDWPKLSLEEGGDPGATRWAQRNWGRPSS